MKTEITVFTSEPRVSDVTQLTSFFLQKSPFQSSCCYCSCWLEKTHWTALLWFLWQQVTRKFERSHENESWFQTQEGLLWFHHPESNIGAFFWWCFLKVRMLRTLESCPVGMRVIEELEEREHNNQACLCECLCNKALCCLFWAGLSDQQIGKNGQALSVQNHRPFSGLSTWCSTSNADENTEPLVQGFLRTSTRWQKDFKHGVPGRLHRLHNHETSPTL